MSIEAMKQALEALELAGGNLCEALHHPKKLQHGIGQPCPAVAKYDKAITALRQAIEQAQKQERNFCPRCGKRLGKNDWDIHTCTPPAEQAQKQEPVAIEALKWIGSHDLSGADDRAIALMAYAFVSKARFAVLETTGERV